MFKYNEPEFLLHRTECRDILTDSSELSTTTPSGGIGDVNNPGGEIQL